MHKEVTYTTSGGLSTSFGSSCGALAATATLSVLAAFSSTALLSTALLSSAAFPTLKKLLQQPPVE